MSAMTDNSFYPFAERIWFCIRLNNARKWACDRLTADADFGKKKKIIFSDEAHFDIGGVCRQAKLLRLGYRKAARKNGKPMHQKQITV